MQGFRATTTRVVALGKDHGRRPRGLAQRCVARRWRLVGGRGLNPSSHSKRTAFDGASRRVIDGPFAETHEELGGFYIIDVASLDEALAWARRIPVPKIQINEA